MGVEEILVHVSGSSSKKDDRRFQAIALAYTTFQPVTSHSVFKTDVTTSAVPGSINAIIHLPVAAPTSSTLSESSSTLVPRTGLKRTAILSNTSNSIPRSDRQAQCTYIEDTPLAAAAIESQLWSSPMQPLSANTSSPLVNRATKRRCLSHDHEFSNNLNDSAPSAPSDLEVRSTTIQNNAMQDGQHIGAGISSSPIHYVSSHESLDVVPATAPARVQGQKTVAPQTQITAADLAIVPSSPTLAPSTPAASTSSTATFRTAPRAVDSWPASPSKTNPTTQTPHFASTAVPQPTSTAALTSPPPALAPPAALSSATRSSTNLNPTLLRLKPPITITPPPPPIGLLPTPSPTSTIPIPSSLARLTANPQLSTRYKPNQQNRALRPLERGHWRIDASTWSDLDATAAHVDFWTSLSTFVESGKAGWDVLVVREDAVSNANADGRVESERRDEKGEVQDARLGTIRFYHFGGVAVHIYLLLFITSKSRVRKCGVEWVDAGGEVVIRM